ncbi:uncharacterized protein LOC126578706 [Anopheles aquasalis]|uniref:uncharacterized protein LOC126578706 n=1 Tax=Anopheles aquasalis TaxID=42839 RepID=UPI00215AB584|nr:uncharacterized protein LOC126578706 [Anopheles aquasalis]
MVSNISRGFREDCLHFLSNFASRESPYFETFCKEWRKANFQYVFCGWTSEVEKVEYTQEVLYIVKQCFLCSQRPLERIGALYLLYTLYMKQPMQSFCKIRVTLSQWQRFREIAEQPYDGQKIPQLSAIVWKMFISEAFLFVQEEIQHGFDSFFVKKCNNNNMDDLARCAMRMEREITTMNAPTGLCKALEILELGYNEMNEALQDGEPSSSDAIVGDKIPQSTLMESLRKDFDSMMTAMDKANKLVFGPRWAVGESGLPKDTIGNRRYSKRQDAFRAKVQDKQFTIATSALEDVEMDDPEDTSPPEPQSSSSKEKPGRKQTNSSSTAGSSKDTKKNIRYTRSKILISKD